MKAIIMAAGSANRWGNYLGVPKQLIKINGEPLLHRTIRLLRENGVKDIIVTVPKKGYFGDIGVEEVEGVSGCEVDKFLNAKQYSGGIFIWGDCYFTESAIKKIVSNKKDLMFFGRRGASKITGKRCGELFAVKTNNEFFKKAEEIKKHKEKMRRCASWELYTYITEGVIPYKNFRKYVKGGVGKRFVHIDDETDDFDYPRDYDRWIKNCTLDKKKTKTLGRKFKLVNGEIVPK